MTEEEYIRATNRVKVSAAFTILRDVLPSKDNEYGITCDELYAITRLIGDAEDKLFSLVEIKEDI